MKDTLIRINQIIRGWANYFRHAVGHPHVPPPAVLHVVADRALATHTAPLEMEGRPPLLTDPTGRWQRITADGIALFDPTSIPIRRYRYRGKAIPNPFTADLQPARRSLVESPVR